jgi:protein-L-isoaspartate(D-aspartate) O-methyltransferase
MNVLDRPCDRMITEQLVERGITDERVLEAMRETPRERFVDPELASEAFLDKALPMIHGQTISQPYIVALMAQQAAIQATDRVLEVGAGSGYGAAILGRLAARVWTIERVPQLSRRAGVIVATLGLSNVTVLRGDGSLGWPAAAPFNAIIVTAAAPEAPASLRQQLAVGGRLIIPIGSPDGQQRLVKIVRKDAETFEQEDICPVAFVPLIGENGYRNG